MVTEENLKVIFGFPFQGRVGRLFLKFFLGSSEYFELQTLPIKNSSVQLKFRLYNINLSYANNLTCFNPQLVDNGHAFRWQKVWLAMELRQYGRIKAKIFFYSGLLKCLLMTPPIMMRHWNKWELKTAINEDNKFRWTLKFYVGLSFAIGSCIILVFYGIKLYNP